MSVKPLSLDGGRCIDLGNVDVTSSRHRSASWLEAAEAGLRCLTKRPATKTTRRFRVSGSRTFSATGFLQSCAERRGWSARLWNPVSETCACPPMSDRHAATQSPFENGSSARETPPEHGVRRARHDGCRRCVASGRGHFASRSMVQMDTKTDARSGLLHKCLKPSVCRYAGLGLDPTAASRAATAGCRLRVCRENQARPEGQQDQRINQP